MIQNFDVQGGADFGRENLPKLRAQLKALNLNGFIVPHEDEYQNEYLPDCNERLMWVSGFTGSAGAAIVTLMDAAIFVDGRYTLQVESQVDSTLFSYNRLENNGLANWIISNINNGARIGYDPKLHTPSGLSKIKEAVSRAGAELIALDKNPIDQAWTDRPVPPLTKVRIQPLHLAGLSMSEKRDAVGNAIAKKNAEKALITAPASIAWLLNIRGSDVMCTPLALSTAIVSAKGHVNLFIHPDKISDEVRHHLGNAVSVHHEDELSEHLENLAHIDIIVDPNVTSDWYVQKLKSAGAKIISSADPIALPKACKNEAEISATTEAHKRDGAALIRYLYWLDTVAQSGEIDEIEAASKLESIRAATGKLKDLSFESISGAGSNGAIVHYRVSKATTQKLEKGSLFLIDSGGQYVDGTTDVTRTVPIGKPSAEMRERFTLVLKGHIALATIRFPKGTTGSALDALARMALWAKGLDYDHGTGHGVGVYLGVHEGPQRISKTPNTIALQPGMIVSNEPGYYKTGGYGIRIENLQYVTPPADIPGGDRPMMGFETLTLAPLHKALIDTNVLNSAEIDYINNYHKNVWAIMESRVEGKVRDWLRDACNPL